MSSLARADGLKAVEYLERHKKDFIKEFLRQNHISSTGTKEELISRLQDAVDGGQIPPELVISFLDHIEGWGNQQVYLYRIPDSPPWRSEDQVRRLLDAQGRLALLNAYRPLLLPPEPELSSIEWSRDRLRLVWIERREWRERVPFADQTGGVDMVLEAYRIRESRGILSFEWDIASGDGALFIQRLPTGEQYEPVRQRMEPLVLEVIEKETMEQLMLGEAIDRIERSDEVRRRQLAYQTRTGAKGNVTSSSRTRDVLDDPNIEEAVDALRHGTGELGNFYWLPEGDLEDELHVKLYGRDGRIGIFRQCREDEVRYVLSRIRHYRS